MERKKRNLCPEGSLEKGGVNEKNKNERGDDVKGRKECMTNTRACVQSVSSVYCRVVTAY